jgi:hypothetical protein
MSSENLSRMRKLSQTGVRTHSRLNGVLTADMKGRSLLISTAERGASLRLGQQALNT